MRQSGYEIKIIISLYRKYSSKLLDTSNCRLHFSRIATNIGICKQIITKTFDSELLSRVAIVKEKAPILV